MRGHVSLIYLQISVIGIIAAVTQYNRLFIHKRVCFESIMYGFGLLKSCTSFITKQRATRLHNVEWKMKMANVREMKNFLESRHVNVSHLIEKDEIEKAYINFFNSNFSDSTKTVHTYTSTLGSLSCLIKTNSARPSIVIFFLHGFGANKEDLANIANMFFGPYNDVKCAFIFPNAPLKLTPNSDEYGWWMIDIQELNRKIMNFQFVEIINDQPLGLDTARQQLLDVFTNTSKIFDVKFSNFVICGFSQGSMLSLDLLFHMNVPPLLVGLFSCGPMMQSEYRRILNSMDPERRTELLKTRIMQSHGSADIIIPQIGGNLVNVFLSSEGFKNDYNIFEGGHTISDKLMKKLFLEIASLVKDKQKQESCE